MQGGSVHSRILTERFDQPKSNPIIYSDFPQQKSPLLMQRLSPASTPIRPCAAVNIRGVAGAIAAGRVPV
jgi:hypothetical protein